MKFFNHSVVNGESFLHYLLLEKRDPDIVNKRRKSSQYQELLNLANLFPFSLSMTHKIIIIIIQQVCGRLR